ncbi:hypothetical protein EVAR_23937_1 [Eumeta japonica]|uniref:RNA-directed DNA polymerase from mobile element jockey n=1 Tax=Eumeta variegata TaxID=151549 RepID=A0A4C1V2H3_EUMVA|nr:hypothetical protein EVAR_23937_1 [Eumeta japonica]
MLSYNACGLASSILELEQCALEYSVDIILVQETFLKPKNPKCCKLNNYVQLRTDRQGAPKGGTALYYRQTLNCSPIDIPPLINLEATGCRLTMSSHGAIIIISVYLPPKKELLRSDVETLFALGDAGLPTENSPKNKTITSWRKVSLLLEETDTPILNNIPDNIETTDEIDYAIGALTNHIATVIEDSSRRSRRPTVAENYPKTFAYF